MDDARVAETPLNPTLLIAPKEDEISNFVDTELLIAFFEPVEEVDAKIAEEPLNPPPSLIVAKDIDEARNKIDIELLLVLLVPVKSTGIDLELLTVFVSLVDNVENLLDPFNDDAEVTGTPFNPAPLLPVTEDVTEVATPDKDFELIATTVNENIDKDEDLAGKDEDLGVAVATEVDKMPVLLLLRRLVDERDVDELVGCEKLILGVAVVTDTNEEGVVLAFRMDEEVPVPGTPFKTTLVTKRDVLEEEEGGIDCVCDVTGFVEKVDALVGEKPAAFNWEITRVVVVVVKVTLVEKLDEALLLPLGIGLVVEYVALVDKDKSR
ncbi:UNVERIFIED_CONTAM: hypothetical protein HDU68_002009 [Siphonaria sp. JEL0065]|nr:hypothetical protein HDU68_002009 [Siphonaria sp. JEL0065]